MKIEEIELRDKVIIDITNIAIALNKTVFLEELDKLTTEELHEKKTSLLPEYNNLIIEENNLEALENEFTEFAKKSIDLRVGQAIVITLNNFDITTFVLNPLQVKQLEEIKQMLTTLTVQITTTNHLLKNGGN